MRTIFRIAAVMALAIAAISMSVAGAQAANASSQTDSTITVLAGNTPDSLDPQVGFSPPAAEADWLVYLPLLTYKHVEGSAGGTLIPGLAAALPTISADGRTYDLTLRKGLKFSNGKAVKASDFAYTIMRAIRLEWGGKSFFTDYIEGAAAYDAGEAGSIAGIVTDDRTGKIRIKLTKPYGAFSDVLALTAGGVVPTGTPMTELGSEPPPGVGPYMFACVYADGSYVLKKNPRFVDFKIPGIPTGYVDRIKISIVEDPVFEAESVLFGSADVFDTSDQIPPEMVPLIEAKAGDRFAQKSAASTFYFFLNTTRAPFNNPKAREAVNVAIDRQGLARMSGGFLRASCHLLPVGIVGHPDTCPYGESSDIAKARQLVEESGMAGTPIAVYGPQRGPKREYIEYYTEMLNQIGFDAHEELIANENYFATIGDEGTDPQTGFSSCFQDFPNPSDFFSLLDGGTIRSTDNSNLSKVNDPFIQQELQSLNEVPSTQLGSVAGRWQALDEYVASQSYIAPFGEQVSSKFLSERLDFGTAVFHVLFGNDFSTLRLK